MCRLPLATPARRGERAPGATVPEDLTGFWTPTSQAPLAAFRCIVGHEPSTFVLCVCVCCSTKTLGDGDTTAEPLSAAMASGKTLRNHLINRPIFPRARQVPHVPPVLQCCEAIFGLALPPEAHVLPTASSSAHSGKNSRTLVGAMQRSLAVLSRNDDMHEPIRCDKVTPTLVGSSDDCCAKSIVDAEPRRMVFNYGPRPWGLPSHISRLQ